MIKFFLSTKTTSVSLTLVIVTILGAVLHGQCDTRLDTARRLHDVVGVGRVDRGVPDAQLPQRGGLLRLCWRSPLHG